MLDRDISTARNNTTRFAALSRTRNQTETVRKREDENFVLVFTVQNDAGSLAQTLNIIGAARLQYAHAAQPPDEGSVVEILLLR